MWILLIVLFLVVLIVAYLYYLPLVNKYLPTVATPILPVEKWPKNVPFNHIRQLAPVIRHEIDNFKFTHINYLQAYTHTLDNLSFEQWDAIPLRLFDYDIPKYAQYCPTLMLLLRDYPEIRSCVLSRIAPETTIAPHRGPYKGLLRYILILEGSPEAYLHINGQPYYLQTGQDLIFDETALHGVVNASKQARWALLLDVDQPNFTRNQRWLHEITLKLLQWHPMHY